MRATPSVTMRNAARSDGFGSFLAAHYRASRLHWIVPVLIGLLAAAALSLLKPRLGGVRGLLIATVSIACVGAGCGAVYFALRVIQYVFLRKRSAATSPPSWLARIAHLCITMLVPVVPLVAAECVGPPRGWLADVLSLAEGENVAPDDPPAVRTKDGRGGSAGTPADSAAKPRTPDPLADPKNPFKVIEE